MSLVFNTKTYTSDSPVGQNGYGYRGALKTVSVKDDLVLRRTAPKPTTVFSGVGRVQSKLTRTLTLTGALTPTGEAIVSIDISFPVGSASADQDAMLNDMGAHLAHADFKLLAKNQQIVF